MIDRRNDQPTVPPAPGISPTRDRTIDPLALEKNQPDPMLAMSTGRMTGGAFALIAVAIVAILAVVFYGLNGHNRTAPGENPTAAVTNSGAPHG